MGDCLRETEEAKQPLLSGLLDLSVCFSHFLPTPRNSFFIKLSPHTEQEAQPICQGPSPEPAGWLTEQVRLLTKSKRAHMRACTSRWMHFHGRSGEKEHPSPSADPHVPDRAAYLLELFSAYFRITTTGQNR